MVSGLESIQQNLIYLRFKISSACGTVAPHLMGLGIMRNASNTIIISVFVVIALTIWSLSVGHNAFASSTKSSGQTQYTPEFFDWCSRYNNRLYNCDMGKYDPSLNEAKTQWECNERIRLKQCYGPVAPQPGDHEFLFNQSKDITPVWTGKVHFWPHGGSTRNECIGQFIFSQCP